MTLIHPPKKELGGIATRSEGLPRAPKGTDRARTSINMSGWAFRVDHLVFRETVLVQRDMFEKVRTVHKQHS